MAFGKLVLHRDPEALALAAAERVAAAARESIAARGRFTLCLTGGSTPRAAYTILAEQGAAAVDWSRAFLFFGDERFVPPDDQRSNYKMVHDSLLQTPAISVDHVFAIPTHAATPRQAADDYAAALKDFFGPGSAWPAFDLVLLGMGDDGHTASLFPGAAALEVADRWATDSPPGVLPPPVPRVTLTFPVFNAAREVVFLVSGANKAKPLADIFSDSVTIAARPAAGIRPVSGQLNWYVDEPAAGSLRTGE